MGIVAALAANIWAFGSGACDTTYPKCPRSSPPECIVPIGSPVYTSSPFRLFVCTGPARVECGLETGGCNELQYYDSTARLYHCDGAPDQFRITSLGTGPTPMGRSCASPYAPCDNEDDPVPMPDPILDPITGTVPTPL